MEDKKDRYWEEIGGGRPDKGSNLTIQPRSIPWPTRLVAKVNEPSGAKISPLLDEYLKSKPHLDYRREDFAGKKKP